MSQFPIDRWAVLRHIVLGAFIGVIVLHPLTKIVYWHEFRDIMATQGDTLWQFFRSRLETAFSIEMLPMSAIFAVIGGSIGFGFALYHLIVVGQHRTMRFLEQELASDLPFLIEGGEGEDLEFKFSVRWDHRQHRSNKALEAVIAKTIAGFMNHRGGSLLVGVADDGSIIGLAPDYSTLQSKDRDGFERCIVDIVKNRLGGDLCPYVHCVFYRINEQDVCRIVVEASPKPVYCMEGKQPHFYLRTGNATHELDVREAMAHLAGR